MGFNLISYQEWLSVAITWNPNQPTNFFYVTKETQKSQFIWPSTDPCTLLSCGAEPCTYILCILVFCFTSSSCSWYLHLHLFLPWHHHTGDKYDEQQWDPPWVEQMEWRKNRGQDHWTPSAHKFRAPTCWWLPPPWGWSTGLQELQDTTNSRCPQIKRFPQSAPLLHHSLSMVRHIPRKFARQLHPPGN